MKTISLWQPWASLIALGLKKVETRVWSTQYRGPIAIHATAGIPAGWLGSSRFSSTFISLLPVEMKLIVEHHGDGTVGMSALCRTLPRGVVLCIANLVDIKETVQVVDDLSDQERAFGNYEEGRYAWFLDKIQPLKTPIAAKGNRRIWNWTPPPELLGMKFERMNPGTGQWEGM